MKKRNETTRDAEQYRMMQAKKLIDWYKAKRSPEGFKALFGEEGKVKVL